jgi:hypothetical protein
MVVCAGDNMVVCAGDNIVAESDCFWLFSIGKYHDLGMEYFVWNSFRVPCCYTLCTSYNFVVFHPVVSLDSRWSACARVCPRILWDPIRCTFYVSKL